MEKSKKVTDNTADQTSNQSGIPSARETVKDYIAQREVAQKRYEELVAEKARLTSINNTLFDMMRGMVFLIEKSEVKIDG